MTPSRTFVLALLAPLLIHATCIAAESEPAGTAQPTAATSPASLPQANATQPTPATQPIPTPQPTASAEPTATPKPAPDEKQWRVLIEPKFMHPAVNFPISGADTAVFVPGYFDGDEIHYFTAEEYQNLGLNWEEFQAKALPNADADLKALTIRYERNKKKVIEYAEVKSEKPIVAASILAPHFLDQFENIFDLPLLVAAPNRNTIYVFPKLASTYQDYSPMVTETYHSAMYPVTTEVLEIGEKSIRAIGKYEEP